MTTTNVDTDAPKRRRRWFQFSLTTMFLLITVLGVWLGTLANSARRQAQAVAVVHRLGGFVAYEDDFEGPRYTTRRNPDPPGPEWLREWLGDDYFRTVTKVNLVRKPVTDDELRFLNGLPQLRQLWMPGSQITDAGLKYLKNCKRLELLYFGPKAITDAGLAHLSQLRNLTWLGLGGTNVTGAGLIHLRHLTKLEHLVLPADSRVTDEQLAYLAGLTNLKELHLGNTRISDAVLKRLGRMENLTFVGLNRKYITAARIRDLRQRLPNVEIGVHGENSSTGLSAVKRTMLRRNAKRQTFPMDRVVGRQWQLDDIFNSLDLSLDLSGTDVRDKELAQLKSVPELERLNLKDTMITDEGLTHLADLSNLRSLILIGTQVTDEGVRRLQDARPRVSVFRDEMPWLGIVLEREAPVVITRVNARSPAKTAGLKEGDRITRIDNRDINDSLDVLAYVKRYRPGDVITIHIERGEEIIPVDVKLARYPK